MANYLFLRGNRNKHFFSDVASELEEKGHTCYQLKFELGELLIPSKIKTVFVPKYISQEVYPISDEELLEMKIYNITYKREMKNTQVSEKELRMYKQYMHFIDQFIEEHHIDFICMFNGYHWIDQVSKYLAEKRNLQTIYFEQGYFRPYTLTCDPQGINNDASIPRSRHFYEAIQMDHRRMKHHLTHPENEDLLNVKGENLTQVALVKVASMLGSVLKVNPNLYAHITWHEAIKYFLFKQGFKFMKMDEQPLPEEFLFVPFQVSRDTQIFYNSSIKSMEELVDLACAHVEEVNRKQNRNIHLVFKEHPEDMPRNNYKTLKKRYKDNPKVMFLQKRSVPELIRKSLGVITINSTVGIEALTQHKPVITLGDAFYNIDGVVRHCTNLSQLDEEIEFILNHPVNHHLISQFLYYLRFNYQLEGNLISRNPATAEHVAEHLDSVPDYKSLFRGEQNESRWHHTCKI
ncbi:hypothetical protein GLW04_09535 [Halobacillus litoralis]|uniref:Capsular biosynthesis protein n=1 Tax=Halobacillus litoralis TaxID=45668 RepID=A0A845DRV6_9BACI|nr:hypothetical protein [Halobacillus litoralis]MYL20126.1 hypothetical protein [Halobacillus litoralis]MYL36442.1 hypothetical protein [Halobacillus litoralis]